MLRVKDLSRFLAEIAGKEWIKITKLKEKIIETNSKKIRAQS